MARNIELQRLLYEEIDRIGLEVLRKNWGYDRPSPGKLIREGHAIARDCIAKVSLDEPDYLHAVQDALQKARDQQDASGISLDGWDDEDGYILSGIGDATRAAEKLKPA